MELQITLVPGSTAPIYDQGTELKCKQAVITEQGTEANLPIVDLVCYDASGRQYLIVLSGRIINGLAHAIMGVNMRNHGKREP